MDFYVLYFENVRVKLFLKSKHDMAIDENYASDYNAYYEYHLDFSL